MNKKITRQVNCLHYPVNSLWYTSNCRCTTCTSDTMIVYSSQNSTYQSETTDNEKDDLSWVVLLMSIIVLVFCFSFCALYFYRKKGEFFLKHAIICETVTVQFNKYFTNQNFLNFRTCQTQKVYWYRHNNWIEGRGSTYFKDWKCERGFS